EFINALRLKVFWKEISSAEAGQQIALFQDRKKRRLYFFPDLKHPKPAKRVPRGGGCTKEIEGVSGCFDHIMLLAIQRGEFTTNGVSNKRLRALLPNKSSTFCATFDF
ncbi:MAG: hypothetical protein ACK5NG_04945, partial [Chthoniobacterales bacterium]